ncbi:hypothetical protein ID1000_07940 [Helicobacter pylori]
MAEQDPKELIFSGITIYADKNSTRAKKYFEKACELNDSDGCVILGDIYHNGGSVTKNFKKSFEHHSKDCGLNEAKGCYALAALYNEAKGTAKDEKQMTESLKKACGLGLKEACGILKEQK